jgi:hypothetical protein
MNTMRNYSASNAFELCPAEEVLLRHRCPVCGTVHEVSAVRAQFAYGRQLACGPNCEAERRRRIRASYRLALSPDSGSGRHATLRAAPAGEHKAVISATVEATDVLRVRRAIFQAGGASVGIVKTAPVPHCSRVRVFIGMKPGALESIITAIMRSVTACEFGRVVRM